MIQNKAQIVRILTLSLCLILGISFCQASDMTGALNSYKELQSNFASNHHKVSEGYPEQTFLTSFERVQSPFGRILSSHPINEQIAMNGNHSKEHVQDINAINSAKQRNIVYDDVQRGDGVNKGNSMDIQVVGPGQGNQNGFEQDDDLGSLIQEKVDSAITSSMDPGLSDKTGSTRIRANNLDIDISGISVRAINTVPSGTAIATSNIIIEPTQIVVEPSEASEKIK
jgi:hypothetical protein